MAIPQPGPGIRGMFDYVNVSTTAFQDRVKLMSGDTELDVGRVGGFSVESGWMDDFDLPTWEQPPGVYNFRTGITTNRRPDGPHRYTLQFVHDVQARLLPFPGRKDTHREKYPDGWESIRRSSNNVRQTGRVDFPLVIYWMHEGKPVVESTVYPDSLEYEKRDMNGDILLPGEEVNVPWRDAPYNGAIMPDVWNESVKAHHVVLHATFVEHGPRVWK